MAESILNKHTTQQEPSMPFFLFSMAVSFCRCCAGFSVPAFARVLLQPQQEEAEEEKTRRTEVLLRTTSLNKVFSQPSSPFDIITTTTAHHGFHLPPPQQPLIDQSTVRPSTHSLEKVALYHAVVECERNSLVYLPRSRGLGRTLVVGMVMRRLLNLNPQRQAFFLVEMDAQVSVRVRTTSSSSFFAVVAVVVVFALKTLPICLSRSLRASHNT